MLALFVCPTPVAAQYATRFTTIDNGAVTFTGNTLGLDAETNQNGQGTRGAIGTFVTTDTSQRDISPAPTTAPQFPFGTTSNWRLNGSQAVLRMPAGARVLHAELIWGGTFAGNTAADNVSASINDSVSFTTPAGTFSVAPDPSTSRSLGTVGGNGICSTNNECYYVRTADVTTLVAAAGAGTYRTGGVPATQGTTDNNNPAAGWTLAVVYEDFNQPIRNLSLFLGLEKSGGAAASIVGFCTPPSGPVSGRLAATAMEGDARITGDTMLFGSSAFLGTADRVQGPRNPLDNFFAGQIVDDSGNLDTSGTFGTRNHTPGAPVVGARQGWDITNVDVSARLRNNQTTAFAQGTTTGDGYYLMGLALQIDVGAPRFRNGDVLSVDRAAAVIGDVLTYTVLLDNSAGTTDANNVVFFDTLPAGTSFVANSLTVNGVTQAGANPVSGVPLGTIAVGSTLTVRFQARVDTVVPTNQRVNQAHWTFDFVSCSGQTAQGGTTVTNSVSTDVPVTDFFITKTLIGTSPVIVGGQLQYRLLVQNAGPSPATGAIVTDPGSTPALVNQTWTCTNGPNGSTCLASGSGPIDTPVFLVAGGQVTFTVTGTLPAGTPPGTFTNTAAIAAPAGVPDFNTTNNTSTLTVPIAQAADLAVTTTGPATGQRGTNVTYTIIVSNNGPSNVQNVVVTNPTPAGLTLVTPLSGPCAAAPGCAIPVGGMQTLTITFAIPPAYAGPDPITSTASATDAIAKDPQPANNTASTQTSLSAPVVDLAVTKTNGVTQVTPGQTTTYTITVTNAGPASAIGSHLVDTFDPAIFGSVQWQCAASGTSSCTTSGPQAGNIDTLVNVDPGAGNAVVITAQALVLSTVRGRTTVTNTATVAAAAGVSESITANDMATDTDTVQTVADLSIVKTGPATIVPGTTADYTITVANAGPSTAGTIVFEEAPEEGAVANAGRSRPDLIQSVQAPADSSCVTQPVIDHVTGELVSIPICTIPSLEPGGTRVFTVRLAIPPDFQVSAGALAITNTAAISSSDIDADPDLNDLTSSVTSTVARQADIVLTKTGPAAVVAGTIASYFVDVSNNGPSAATSVQSGDILPIGLTVVGGSGPCVASFTAGSPCAIGTLAPGQHATTRIDLQVPADYTGPSTVTNSAVAVSADVPEVDGSNNQMSVSTLIVPNHADTGVTLTGPSIVAPGGTIEYVARVTNFGPGPAFNVTSSDVIPAGATLVNGTVPPGPTTCTPPTPGSTNLVSCLTQALQVGESLEFRFTLQVDANATPGSVLTNLASVSSPTPDFNPGNKQAIATTLVAAATDTDLSVTKTDNTDPAIAGNAVTYTILVSNAGPAPATGVTLTDVLPPQLTLLSASPSQGSCVGAVCSLGTLAASATATVTIEAMTSATGTFTDTATVTGIEHDPVPANNTIAESTTIATADQADLSIQKIGPTVIGPGESTFYRIVVTNRGPATAANVQVGDTLPPETTFVGNSGDCATPFPCSFDALAPGQTVVINTAFTVDSALTPPGSLVNTATVSSSTTPDPDTTNNTGTVTTEVQATNAADLSVMKRDSPDAVVAGTTLSYALTVLNRGPGAAPNAVLTDVMPPGVTLIAATPTQGSCSGTTTITCTLGTMAPGSVVEIGILATAPAGPGTLTNTASAGSGAPDPNPGNNESTENTDVLPGVADLAITKILATPAIPGLTAGYQIVVTNRGPSAIAGATVVDNFPAALGVVSWTCIASAGSLCGAGSGSGPIATTVDLQNGGTATFVATATIASSATGSLSNTAAVTAPAGASDPDATNNVAISTVPLMPAADLQMSKIKTGAAQATPGTNITFTLSVTNAGPSDAAGVTLLDPVPGGLMFVSGGGACAAYPCALGAIPAGGTVVATATFAIPPGYTTPDPIVNTATASSATTPDPNAANNTATAMTAISAPVTDLSITKTNGVSTVVPGSTTTYTITVTNAGPTNAIGATVTDVFPASFTAASWTCASATGGSCGAPSGTGNINTTVNVPVGASVIFTVAATVAPDAVGVLVNTAAVAPGPGASDPTSANNTDIDTLTPQADLAITKTGPATIAPNQPLVYTIAVTNNGPSNAEHVRVADPAPTGLQFVSTAGACTTTFPCDLGTIPAGATRTITTTFIMPSALAAVLPITNVATVSSTTPDPNAANDSAQAQTALNRDADIDVTTLIAPATGVHVGDTIVVTVNVLNRGPNPATGVVITDNLPAGFQFVSATPSAGTYDSATGAWTIGDVDLNATARLDLTVIVTAPGSITNFAVKTAENEPDANTANDSAAATINAAPAADLAVEKTTSVSEPLVGQPVTFTVRVTNRGPSPATGVAIADTLPAGVTFVSATPSAGSYDSSSGIWTIGAIAVSGEAVLTLDVTVDQPGALSNNAVVTAHDQLDPNPLNNSGAASINAQPNADLRIAKAVSNPAPAVGTDVTYTIAVTNLGPSAATSATILDLLPAGVTFVSATPSQGAYDAGTGVWTLDAMPVTTTETLSIVGRVTQLQTIDNTATRQASGPVDPNPVNDSATAAATSAIVADLAIFKTPTVASVIAGGPVTWTIGVTNHGPSAVSGAPIADVFPPTVANVQWTCTASTGGACGAASGTGSIGTTIDLPANGTATFVASGTVASGATGTLDNVATVAPPAGATDPDLTNNTAHGPVQVTAAADLQVTGTGPASATPGTSVSYSFTIVNVGPSVAAAATFNVPTPAGVTLQSVTGDCTALPCVLGAVAPGQTRTVTIAYAVPPGYPGSTPIVVVGTASSPSDTNLENNSATISTIVATLADLSITKTAPAALPDPGGTMVFELVVANHGPRDALDVVVDDPAPAGLTFETNAGDCTTPFPCHLGTLAAGEVRRIQATFRSAAGTPVINVATVRSTTPDPNPANNRATSATPGSADLAVTKVRVGALVPGESVRYVITVTNNGPADVDSATLTDPTPAGTAFVANTGACVVAFPCTLGRLVSGASMTVNATFLVLPGTPLGAVVTNEATVTSATPDAVPANNVARDVGIVAASTDDDHDGMPDDCEINAGLDPTRDDAGEDPDGDGLTNAQECGAGSHPRGFETYYLPEGAQNDFFAARFAIENLSPTQAAHLRIRRQGENGVETGVWLELPPGDDTVIDAHSLLVAPGSFATLIESDQPLIAERTMDMVTGSSHADLAVDRLSASWYFAEGATTDGFKLFYLLQNPHNAATTATITYLRGGLTPVTRTYALPPHARVTVYLNDDPDLAGHEVSAFIQAAPLPIAAARAMYRDFDDTLAVAGASSSGVGGLGSDWLFAEGAAGSFDLWLLLTNFDGTQACDVEVEYILGNGQTLVRPVTIPPQTRVTVRVNDVDPALRLEGSIAMRVRGVNGVPFLAERAMWWPGGLFGTIWYEGHHGTPVTGTAPHWRFAAGPDGAFDIYLLIANFGSSAGRVVVTLTYDDGTTSARVVDVTGPGRLTLRLNDLIPESTGRRFRIDVQSDGTPLPLVVERSTYQDRLGRTWAAGTNVVGVPVP